MASGILPFEGLHDRSSILITSGLVILLALLIQLRRPAKRWPYSNGASFTRHDGRTLQCMQGDTRFTRFTSGVELSKQGQELAGDEPYLVRNGSKTELVIHTPRQVRDFLEGDLQQHTKAHNMHLGEYIGSLFGQCVGEQNGVKWKTMRAHFDPHYSVRAVTGVSDNLDAEIRRWIRSDLACDATLVRDRVEPPTYEVDVMERSKALMFRLIAQNLYGAVFDDELFEQLKDLYNLHCQVMLTGVLNPRTISWWYNLLPTNTRRQYLEYKSRWRRLNMTILETARANKTLRCPAADIYLGVDRDKNMSEDEYLQTLDEILFANVNVSGTVLAFVFINLAASPKVQDRLLAEYAAEADSTAYLSRQDTLLHYTILESHRITPSVRFSLPELTGDSPKNIDGFAIPPQMPVIVDICRLHMNTTTWSPDPEVFRPDRFYDITTTEWRHGLLRFGVGTGRCLGRFLADRILKLAALRVMKEFALRPAGVGRNGEGGDEAGFTVGHKGKVELVRRAPEM